MTDVNIAVQLLVEAFTDRFDTAFLISAEVTAAGVELRRPEGWRSGLVQM